MPFKKYQSLTDTFTRNKRLSTWRFGRRWRPRGDFWASGLRADSRTPRRGLARGVPSRAVVGAFQMLSAGDDNKRFPYKDDAHLAAGLSNSTLRDSSRGFSTTEEKMERSWDQYYRV